MANASFSIGGNTGTVNSFAGVDVSDITGGLLDTTKLLAGNQLMCFVMEVVKTVAPTSLSTLFRVVDAPLKLLTDAIGAALLNITACPAFGDMTVGGQDLETGLRSKFPGARTDRSVL